MISEIGSFDQSWESIYKQGQMLNRYPFNLVVAITMRYFGAKKNRKNIKVLDLGCGAGNHCWFFAREGFSVTGIDASASAIQYARQRFRDEKLEGEFIKMDFEQLHTLKQKFDLILDREALYTLDFVAIKRVMREVKRMLSTDGIFLSFFYNKEHPGHMECGDSSDNRTYYRVPPKWFGETNRITLLDKKSLQEMMHGFEILELYNHKIEPIITSTCSGVDVAAIAEYIIVARKARSDE